jgi:cytochrome c peroxidase
MYMKHRPWAPGAAAAALLLRSGVIVTVSLAATARGQGPQPPLGLPPIPWPTHNPYSQAKAELGRLLYFDRRLSSDGSVACASCHSPAHAFTDAAPVSTGIRGQQGGRSAPPVINRAYSAGQFWDGRTPSLEEQAKGPLANPREMTSAPDAVAAHRECEASLRAIPGYRQRFRQVFQTEAFTIDHVAQAIATFERTILSGDSPYDRYQAGDRGALSPEQVRGMGLFFGKAGCARCHRGFNFTDEAYHNSGVGMDRPNPDLGRCTVTKQAKDRGAFKTPTLREIDHTAPYMHDGSLTTLEEVVEHYNQGGIHNPYLDARIEPLQLTEPEKKELVAFMKALSGKGWQQVKEPKPQEFP